MKKNTFVLSSSLLSVMFITKPQKCVPFQLTGTDMGVMDLVLKSLCMVSQYFTCRPITYCTYATPISATPNLTKSTPVTFPSIQTRARNISASELKSNAKPSDTILPIVALFEFCTMRLVSRLKRKKKFESSFCARTC